MVDQTRMQELARELAANLGEERAESLLERSRALMVLRSSESGASSSEFKVVALCALAGMALVGLGLWRGREDLVGEGVDLVKVVGGAYAVARGLAKAGQAVGARRA